VYMTWIDGYVDPPAVRTNGSTIGHTVPFEPSMESGIVYDGIQSAPLYYDNTFNMYSEVTLTLDRRTNWTLYNVTTLSIAIHGRAPFDDPAIGNDPDKIYVIVEDTTGKTGIANHPNNPDATTLAGWYEWLIDLAEIADQGVDLSRVKTLTIRIGDKSKTSKGLIYIDGIRLYADALAGLSGE